MNVHESPEALRSDIGRVIARDYPEFSGLESSFPDDLVIPVLGYMALCPSVPFLDYCSAAVSRKSPEVAENHIRNLLSVLPDVKKILSNSEGIRERSAVVSLTVSVVEDMAAQCLGTLVDEVWDAGVSNWVWGASFVAQRLPYHWNLLSRQDRLRIYMALAAAQGSLTGLVELCEERGTLDPDLVRDYFKNKATPLKVGIL